MLCDNQYQFIHMHLIALLHNLSNITLFWTLTNQLNYLSATPPDSWVCYFKLLCLPQKLINKMFCHTQVGLVWAWVFVLLELASVKNHLWDLHLNQRNSFSVIHMGDMRVRSRHYCVPSGSESKTVVMVTRSRLCVREAGARVCRRSGGETRSSL